MTAEAVAEPSHILVVDDDKRLRELLRKYLAEQGFRVTVAADAGDARRRLDGLAFDLIVLDIMMPGENGLELTRALREKDGVPILLLTAMGEPEDRISGPETGADDYLAKPFEPRELVLRIRTILRRRRAEVRQGKPEGIRAYRFDGWELNLNTRRLRARDGRSVSLSNGEFSLLVVLLGAPNRILSRDQLLDLSRLHNDEVYNRSIDVQILRLRRKIEPDASQPRYIKTERGAGYLFGVPVETVY